MSAMNRMPSGYKQTEVGVIPEDWSVSTVGAEFDIQLGKMLDTEKNVGIPKPYLGNKSVQWNRIDVSDLSMMAMSSTDLQRYRLMRGDLLVCEGGEVGRAAIWDDQLTDCYYQKALHRLRPKRGFDSGLMAELLRYWADHGLLVNYVTQTSIAHLTREKFNDVPMSVPPLPEQRAIAAALSDVDALLAAQDKLIAKKRDIKQAAMQQLLTGKQRLPGFSGEWEVKRVVELGEIVTGGTPRTDAKDFWGGKYPWITPTDISSNRDMFISERGVTQKGLDSIRVLPANTVLVTCIASIGKNAILRTIGGCNQQINAVIPNKNNNAEFLYYLFEFSKQYLLANAGTTATSIISKATFGDMYFTVPTLDEQVVIATVLSDMDADLAALEQQRDKTRALKQGMMQELLTGRIRLV